MMDTELKPVVRLRNVNKVYKLYKKNSDRIKAKLFKNVKYTPKYAINDVSLDIYEGESVALIGRNGAGKSTLLKLITGVSYPTEGHIRVNGRVCALLELTSGFDPEMSGRDNIYLKAGILGLSSEEIERYEEEIVDFAELGPYINMPVRTYSSGMKARLGFAVSISFRPDILIVDEALSVGDVEFRTKCRERISEMVAAGVTLLFVTHSMQEAAQFCKRGIVLKSGHVVFDGPIDDALNYYSTAIRRRQQGKKKNKRAAAAE